LEIYASVISLKMKLDNINIENIQVSILILYKLSVYNKQTNKQKNKQTNKQINK